ncbi:MAG: hypothetical protein Kow0069_06110 [Promethearchaeota archaeon]
MGIYLFSGLNATVRVPLHVLDGDGTWIYLWGRVDATSGAAWWPATGDRGLVALLAYFLLPLAGGVLLVAGAYTPMERGKRIALLGTIFLVVCYALLLLESTVVALFAFDAPPSEVAYGAGFWLLSAAVLLAFAGWKTHPTAETL